MSFISLLWLAISLVNQPTTTKVFQTPSKVSDDYLAQPHGIAFDGQGRLLVVDAKQSQVMVWDKNGTYLNSFSRKGEGPGELNYPTCIASSENQIWVTDGSQRLHQFNRDGTYRKSVAIRVFARVLLAVDSHTALIGARSLNPRENRNQMEFFLIDTASGEPTALKSWPNESVIGLDGNQFRWKAFGDDIDAQRNADGSIYFGFSQDPVLYALKQLQPQPGIQLNVPSAPPTETERQTIKEMSFPGNKGQRFTLGKSTNWIWDFSQAKAIYTHFLVKDSKVLLVLTPLGSIQGIGGAYSKGTYFILDRKSGTPLRRGSYAFPEDSLIFFEDGRMLGFILGEDGQFSIKEFSIDGF